MVIELILLALFTIPIFYEYYMKTWRLHKLTKNIPSEPAYPLIGHAYMTFKIRRMTDMLQVLDKLSSKFMYHGITKLWFGPILIIGVCDPKYIEVIANSPYAMTKGEYYFMLAGDIAHGVAVANGGTKWKELRKPLVKSLTKKIIGSDYHQVFVKRSNGFMQYIRQNKLGVEFDIIQVMSNLSLDIFSENLLGVQTNEVIENKFKFVENFDTFAETFVVLSIRYLFYFKKIGEHFSELGKTLKRSKSDINKFLQWVLDERMKSNRICKGSTEYYSDFLLRRASEKKIPFEEIRKELADSVVAGSDTSSVVASSALVFLAMFPHIQEKAYQEQLSIFGHTKRDVTVDDLESMTYLRMVIKETIRLVSPPGFGRCATGDIKLDKYTIPKGAVIYISQKMINQNPKYWEKPEEFYPEHFLPGKEAERPSHTFNAFGIAPRGCPGMIYGMNSVLVLLSTIIRNFEVQTSLKYENIVFDVKLLLQIANGYYVKFIERNKV